MKHTTREQRFFHLQTVPLAILLHLEIDTRSIQVSTRARKAITFPLRYAEGCKYFHECSHPLHIPPFDAPFLIRLTSTFRATYHHT